MKFLKQISYDFIENFGNKDQKSLLFYGPPGLGKTFLCTSIAKALMDNSKTVLYYSSSELFNRLSDYTFSRETFLKTSSKEIHDLIMDTQLLIIDDLGSEMTNSFVINQLFNILNLREMHARKLIISTNLTPKELNEVYGDRIFSRMVMHFDFYKFYGSDIRWKL
jgi:DNA replication protein